MNNVRTTNGLQTTKIFRQVIHLLGELLHHQLPLLTALPQLGPLHKETDYSTFPGRSQCSPLNENSTALAMVNESDNVPIVRKSGKL